MDKYATGPVNAGTIPELIVAQLCLVSRMDERCRLRDLSKLFKSVCIVTTCPIKASAHLHKVRTHLGLVFFGNHIRADHSDPKVVCHRHRRLCGLGRNSV